MRVRLSKSLCLGIVFLWASELLCGAQATGKPKFEPPQIACSIFGDACRTLNEMISAHDELIKSANMACFYAEFPNNWFADSSHDYFFLISTTTAIPREKDGRIVQRKVFEIETVKNGVPEDFPYRFPQELINGSGISSSVDETEYQLTFFYAGYKDDKQINQMELNIRKPTGRFRQSFDVVHELHGTCFNLVAAKH